MRRGFYLAVAFAAALAATTMVSGQRRVTRVDDPRSGLQGKNENRNPADSIDYSKLVHSHDEMGNVILIDTINGREVKDTASVSSDSTSIPKMKYPLFYSASASVDIWDPVMRAFGQHYGLIEFSGELNLHNRYIPVVEIGLGQADYTPDDNNYTYKVGLTPYFRVGMNYNFLYNSNPDYMVFAGLRYGWSHFNFDVENVTLQGGYWDEEANFNLPRQSVNVSYLQVLFGLRVKVWKQISMGWTVRYKTILHESECNYGKPWYIPGYGSRKGAITGSFSITYTIPFRHHEADTLAAALSSDLPQKGEVSDAPLAPGDTIRTRSGIEITTESPNN